MNAGDLQGGRQTGEGGLLGMLVLPCLSQECQGQVLHSKEAKVSQRMKIIPGFTYYFFCLKKNLNYKLKLQDNGFFLVFTFYIQSCRYRASPVRMLFLYRLCSHPALLWDQGKEAVKWGYTV